MPSYLMDLPVNHKSVRRLVAAIAASLLLASNLSAADNLTQPLRQSPDGHFLTQPDGTPFFWLADTAWPLFARLSREDADRYFQDRAAQGFTVIQAVVLCGPWDNLQVPNRYGALALINRDLAHPNPKYFEHVDWIIDRAAHYGLRMALLPMFASTWLYSNQCGGGKALDTDRAQAYGRWLGERYRGKGIVWILGGDINPLRPAHREISRDSHGNEYLDKKKSDLTIIDDRPIYDSMARGLIQGEGRKPLISYHPSDGSFSGTAPPRMSLYFGERDWYGLDMLQSGHNSIPAYIVVPIAGYDFSWSAPANYEMVWAEYTSRAPRPVIDGETRYEGEPIDYDPAKGFWAAYDSRNAAYHALFAGAAGHTFGNNSVHQLYDPAHNKPEENVDRPWQDSLQSAGAQQMKHVKALMLSRPFFTRIPDQSMLKSDPGIGADHISATRDKDGSYAMIYLPHGQAVTVDLTKLAGARATGWWFDPRTGAASPIELAVATTGAREFRPPTTGPENDWILVLDAVERHFPAPGSVNPVPNVHAHQSVPTWFRPTP